MLLEKIKEHWVFGQIVYAAIIITATWGLLQKLYVEPRDFRISVLEKQVSDRDKQIETLNAKTGEDTSILRNPWILNIDSPTTRKSALDKPLITSSQWVQVEWSGERTMVIQVHDYQANGALVFPVGNPHRESSSGVQLPKLNPGRYEVKAWNPGARSPEVSCWIEVH